MVKLHKHLFVMILGGMFIYLQATLLGAHASSLTDDTGGAPLQTETNLCRPIRVNGIMVPTEPEYITNFPITLHGIKQHYVCKISVPGPPRDCSEIQASGVNISGVYSIYPGGVQESLHVYCDMETDGGGWTMFQRREDGSVDFWLDWANYKVGFGNVSGEHWLGNDNIHRLSTQKTYELRVDLEDFEGETRYASYGRFNISDEADNYRLTIGDYFGNAGDSLEYHQGRPFSTQDRDNDDAPQNCALSYTGAWWYNYCHRSNLNGQYLDGTTIEDGVGVAWLKWHGHYYSLKNADMKIRPAFEDDAIY